jgi:hypothetical protein
MAKKRFWRHLLEDIQQGRNIELYLTILGVVSVFVLDLFNAVDPGIVSTAVLGVLGLVAVSLLSNRRKDDMVQQALQQIQERQKAPSLGEVFSSWRARSVELEARLSQADEVWVLTRTGINFWSSYQNELMRVLKRDGTVRLIILDPNGIALRLYKSRFKRRWSQVKRAELMHQNIKALLEDLKDLSAELPRGTLEIRTVDYMAPWAIVLIDPHSPDGMIQVGLGMFGPSGEVRPSFVLRGRQDSDLFHLFCEEFEAMWEHNRSIVNIEEAA